MKIKNAVTSLKSGLLAINLGVVVTIASMSLITGAGLFLTTSEANAKSVEKHLKKAKKHIEKGSKARANGNDKKADRQYGKADKEMDKAEEHINNR